MSITPKQDKAIAEVKAIFRKVHKVLKVNRRQNEQRVIFDMLSAIDNAAYLLGEAWKISQLHNIADEHMRREFIGMYEYFGKVRKNVKNLSKYKN